jgi:thiamine-phosphate pyrophosphorylase
VHVGQDELSIKDARRIIGTKKLVGVSTHSLQQARQAVLDGADYVGVGPTFPSTTKSFSEFVGLDLARQVAAEISLPAYAIGGITVDNLPQVVATAIHGVAVGAAIVQATDPAVAAQAMLKQLRK